MKKLLTVSAVVVAVLTASGCSSPPTTSSPAAAETTAEVQTTEPSTTPETANETKTPVTSPIIATTNFALTDADGFQANIKIDWHKRSPVRLADLPQNCVLSLVGIEDTRYNIEAQLITMSADYPTVNGFTWNQDTPIHMYLMQTDLAAPTTTVCGDSLADFQTLAPPTPGSPPKEIFGVSISERTPRNPTGKIDFSKSDLVVGTKDSYKNCTVQGVQRIDSPCMSHQLS